MITNTQLVLKTNQSIRFGIDLKSTFDAADDWTIEDDPNAEPLCVVVYKTDTPEVKVRINRDCVLAIVTTETED